MWRWVLCCCALVVPQRSLLRPSEEVSFVLLRKLRFVDSEAGFYHRCLEDSGRVGSPWPVEAACSCSGLARSGLVWNRLFE